MQLKSLVTTEIKTYNAPYCPQWWHQDVPPFKWDSKIHSSHDVCNLDTDCNSCWPQPRFHDNSQHMTESCCVCRKQFGSAAREKLIIQRHNAAACLYLLAWWQERQSKKTLHSRTSEPLYQIPLQLDPEGEEQELIGFYWTTILITISACVRRRKF